MFLRIFDCVSTETVPTTRQAVLVCKPVFKGILPGTYTDYVIGRALVVAFLAAGGFPNSFILFIIRTIGRPTTSRQPVLLPVWLNTGAAEVGLTHPVQGPAEAQASRGGGGAAVRYLYPSQFAVSIPVGVWLSPRPPASR